MSSIDLEVPHIEANPLAGRLAEAEAILEVVAFRDPPKDIARAIYEYFAVNRGGEHG